MYWKGDYEGFLLDRWRPGPFRGQGFTPDPIMWQSHVSYVVHGMAECILMSYNLKKRNLKE